MSHLQKKQYTSTFHFFADEVWGDCDPKPGAGVFEGFIQVHVCSRRHVAGRQYAETAPHRNGTLPEDSGPAGAELHTAESRRVTEQEGLGNGYIRSKLLPLVDRMTDFLLLFFSCPHRMTASPSFCTVVRNEQIVHV